MTARTKTTMTLILTFTLSLIALPRVHAGAWAQLQGSLGALDGGQAGAGRRLAMAEQPPTPGATRAVADEPDLILGTFNTPDGPLIWQQRHTAWASENTRTRLTAADNHNNDIGDVLGELRSGWVVAVDEQSKTKQHFIYYDASKNQVMYIPIDKIKVLGKDAPFSGLEAKADGPLVSYTGENGTVVKVRMTPTERVLGYSLAFKDDKFQDAEILSASMVGEVLNDRSVITDPNVAAKLNTKPEGRTSRGDADPIKNDKTWAESITAWLSGPNRSVVVVGSANGRLQFKLRETTQQGDRQVTRDKHYIYLNTTPTGTTVSDYPVR